jgi:hypothetical protein
MFTPQDVLKIAFANTQGLNRPKSFEMFTLYSADEIEQSKLDEVKNVSNINSFFTRGKQSTHASVVTVLPGDEPLLRQA